jgi:membrane-associated protein
LLLAAGAFAALGDFNIVVLVLLAFSASVCGDNLGYFLGRWVGGRLLDWLAHRRRFRLLTPQRLEQAHHYFSTHGAWAIFLSRFLILALGGIINLLAGAERYSYPRFLLYDLTGELLGALIPLLLGYLFSASWEMIGNILGYISLFALSLCIVIVLAFRFVTLLRRHIKGRVGQKPEIKGAHELPVSTQSLLQTSDEQPL